MVVVVGGVGVVELMVVVVLVVVSIMVFAGGPTTQSPVQQGHNL